MTNEEYRIWLIENQHIFIDVQPIDYWSEWTFSILCEDCFAPICCIFKSPEENIYPSYREALSTAIEYVKNNLLA